MTASLNKEFRALLLPWVVAALAAGLLPLCATSPEDHSAAAELLGVLRTLAGFGLCTGIGLVAASSLGLEFQQRTMSLLLTQPVERWRLWKEKLEVVAMALAAVGFFYFLGWGLATLAKPGTVSVSFSSITGDDVNGMLLSCAVVVATICSTSFWTIAARSTIGGLVLSIMSQFLAAGGTAYVLNRIYEDDLPAHASVLAGVIVVVGLGYSALFLWLGWRKFAGLELRDTAFGEATELTSMEWAGQWWRQWLVCRPAGCVQNLLRKELMLQKPVVLAAGVFTVCWLVTMALHQLWPERGFHHLYGILLAFYVPLVLLLAGCVSVSEEKTLGLAAWQLTLPVSARRLWFAKLSVASAVGLLLGYVLPWLLIALAVVTDRQEQIGWALDGPNAKILLFLAWATILVSFWASTQVSGATRAVLTGIIAPLAWGACAVLALWCTAGPAHHASGRFETPLLTALMTQFQLSPTAIANAAEWMVRVGRWLGGGALALLLLRQSFTRFRRDQGSWKGLVKSGAWIGAVAFVWTFLVADFASSAYGLYQSRPQIDVENAFKALAFRQAPGQQGKTQSVTLAELEQAAPLSAGTKRWLRGTSLSYKVQVHDVSGGDSLGLPRESRMQHRRWLLCNFIVKFPNGRKYECGFTDPLEDKK